MRHVILASHAHFAQGIAESVALLAGTPCDIRVLSCFVDGNNDVAALAQQEIGTIADGDEVVVCTDLLGGSVNNEFLKIVQGRANVHLITNMNLPLLLTLTLGLDDGEDLAGFLRELVASDDMRPVYCNDVLVDVGADEEF
jgi:fructoselysine and glucoselysine-specific PTS system IIA component